MTTIHHKTSRATTEAADKALDEGIRITLDGEVYQVRVGDVTSGLTRELRARSGMSFNRLMETVTTDPDTDVIAAFIWLARRIAGETVDFDEVDISYRQLLGDGFDIDAPGAPDADPDADSPEA